MAPVVLDFIAHFARMAPQKLAAVDLSSAQRWTYAELDEAVARCAAVLQHRTQGEPGARVAVLSRNSVHMLVLHFACSRAGTIFVPLNWRLAAPEVAQLLADCGPSLLVLEDGFAQLLPADSDVPRLSLGERNNELLAAMEALPRPRAPAQGVPSEPARPVTLLYSSGTTGRPKGAIVTELSACASSLNLGLGTKVCAQSVFLCDMPLFHTAGLIAAARTPLLFGGTVLVSQRFEAPLTYERLTNPALGITHYFSVPQMAMSLRQLPGFDGRRLAGLTAFITGGAPNPAAHVRRWLDDGVMMTNAWGMSETGSALNQPVGDLERLRRKSASAGLPLLSTEMKIVAADGTEQPDGEVGEIWIRGPHVTPGYWRRPELDAAAFTDGWFRTGDAAFRDAEGFFTLVDRIKDMYISGGENVYPAEVEAAIVELDGVAEVAVIGVADERWGEVGCAFVVCTAGARISEAQILGHCRQRLAHYKVPKSVIFRNAILRTASGKVQKHLLRELHAGSLTG